MSDKFKMNIHLISNLFTTPDGYYTLPGGVIFPADKNTTYNNLICLIRMLNCFL